MSSESGSIDRWLVTVKAPVAGLVAAADLGATVEIMRSRATLLAMRKTPSSPCSTSWPETMATISAASLQPAGSSLSSRPRGHLGSHARGLVAWPRRACPVLCWSRGRARGAYPTLRLVYAARWTPRSTGRVQRQAAWVGRTRWYSMRLAIPSASRAFSTCRPVVPMLMICDFSAGPARIDIE